MMYPCNSRMRHPTGLMGVYLPLDSTLAKQIPSPGLKASLSMRNTPQFSRTLSAEPTQKSMQQTVCTTGGGKKALMYSIYDLFGV